jgi:hypothetical protein
MRGQKVECTSHSAVMASDDDSAAVEALLRNLSGTVLYWCMTR